MFFFACFVALVFSQGPGAGISKSTWAATNTTHTYSWLMKYLPVGDADDSCTNNKCTCGSQGRVHLNTGLANNGTFGVSQGFGIHTVWAAGKDDSRADASGSLSVADVEDLFDSKLGDFSTFSVYSDYNLGLWANKLDTYITKWAAADVPMKFYSFKYDDKTYYSVMTRITGSQVVLEIFSNTKPTENTSDIEETDEVRMAFKNGVPSILSSRMEALQVSRASSDLASIKSFYKTVFKVDPLFTQTTSDGTNVMTFQLNSQATVQIRYVQRPNDDTDRGIKWFENYLNAVHDTYMTSYKSCWDIWGDNHYAIDSQQLSGDEIVSIYKENGWKYHLFTSGGKKKHYRGPPSRGHTNGYFVAPNGWQIQIDGQFSSCSDCGSFQPDLCTTACE